MRIFIRLHFSLALLFFLPIFPVLAQSAASPYKQPTGHTDSGFVLGVLPVFPALEDQAVDKRCQLFAGARQHERGRMGIPIQFETG